MFTILDYSSALEYSIIRRYTNIVYYYYYPNPRPLTSNSEYINQLQYYIPEFNAQNMRLGLMACLDRMGKYSFFSK